MTAPISLNAGGSLYDRIGPDALAALVRAFYARVAQDPLLTPIFPDDLTLTAEKQLAFLTGFLGGPPLYQGREMKEVHGNMRISNAEFDATIGDLKASLDNLGVATEVQKELLAVVESSRPLVVTER